MRARLPRMIAGPRWPTRATSLWDLVHPTLATSRPLSAREATRPLASRRRTATAMAQARSALTPEAQPVRSTPHPPRLLAGMAATLPLRRTRDTRPRLLFWTRQVGGWRRPRPSARRLRRSPRRRPCSGPQARATARRPRRTRPPHPPRPDTTRPRHRTSSTRRRPPTIRRPVPTTARRLPTSTQLGPPRRRTPRRHPNGRPRRRRRTRPRALPSSEVRLSSSRPRAPATRRP